MAGSTRLNCRLCMWTGDSEKGTHRAKAPNGQYHYLCERHRLQYEHKYTDIHPLSEVLTDRLTTPKGKGLR